ncbi:hypothetical protein NJ76_01825, partial [Rhodococcus sp. IITR03]
MVTTPIVVAPAIDFADVRAEFDLVGEFPPEALADARHATDRYADVREDRTDLPLVTIDPPGSMDLDQALHLERTDDGFVLHYAIADVYALVEPGGALDVETHRRGQTFYLPTAPCRCIRARCPRHREPAAGRRPPGGAAAVA